jgi:hypothetical protein
MSSPSARAASLAPVIVATAAVGIVLLLVGVVVAPILMLERAEDWRAYAEAADSLRSGAPLYAWTTFPDIRSYGLHAYLYPPPLAAIWAIGLSAPSFVVVKVVAFAVAIWLLARSLGAPTLIAAAIAVAGVTSSPAIHDLALGNVMLLFGAAVAFALASPGWLGSSALGAVCAIALKPAIGPFVLWLVVRRRSSFAKAFVAGLVTTAVFAVVVGPGRYFEYIQALPKTAVLAAPFTGNLGLAAISPVAAVVGIVLAYVWTIAAAALLDERRAAIVALSMTQLAQPTIGLNYAVLLIPALVLLGAIDRRIALALAVLLPFVVILSPILAAVLLATAATIGERLPLRSWPARQAA